MFHFNVLKNKSSNSVTIELNFCEFLNNAHTDLLMMMWCLDWSQCCRRRCSRGSGESFFTADTQHGWFFFLWIRFDCWCGSVTTAVLNEPCYCAVVWVGFKAKHDLICKLKIDNRRDKHRHQRFVRFSNGWADLDWICQWVWSPTWFYTLFLLFYLSIQCQNDGNSWMFTKSWG